MRSDRLIEPGLTHGCRGMLSDTWRAALAVISEFPAHNSPPLSMYGNFIENDNGVFSVGFVFS